MSYYLNWSDNKKNTNKLLARQIRDQEKQAQDIADLKATFIEHSIHQAAADPFISTYSKQKKVEELLLIKNQTKSVSSEEIDAYLDQYMGGEAAEYFLGNTICRSLEDSGLMRLQRQQKEIVQRLVYHLTQDRKGAKFIYLAPFGISINVSYPL